MDVRIPVPADWDTLYTEYNCCRNGDGNEDCLHANNRPANWFIGVLDHA